MSACSPEEPGIVVRNLQASHVSVPSAVKSSVFGETVRELCFVNVI
jgi:hypothetical protein